MAIEHSTTAQEQKADNPVRAARYPSRSSRRKLQQDAASAQPGQPSEPGSEPTHPGHFVGEQQPPTTHYVKTAVLVSLASVVTLAVSLGLFFLAPGGFYSNANALSLVKVSGKLGTQPILQLVQPVGYAPYATRTLISGNGVKVRGGGPVYVRVSVYSGSTGVNLTPEGQPVARYGLATQQLLGEDLYSTVVGQREGSRLLLVRPVKQSQVASTEMEVDVVDIMPTQLSNTIALPEGFPIALTFSKSGPKFEGVSGDLESLQLPYFVKLLNGTGEALYNENEMAPNSKNPAHKAPSQAEHLTGKWKFPVVQYAVWDLATGQAKTNTWAKGGPELINPEYFYEGLQEEMETARVGSRILAVLPGGGEDGHHPLLLLMDILGTQTPILD